RLAVKDAQVHREHQQHEDVKPDPQPNLIHDRSSSLGGVSLTENKKDEAFIRRRLHPYPPVSRRGKPPGSYSCRPSFTSELAAARGKWNCR
ncbi:MAG TPA: hypothetical protein VNZ44_18005, partial [Pyrinomonadaceae bacterium]|nr:hypothetical protein [Pyrinomonadaceae bacterium]